MAQPISVGTTVVAATATAAATVEMEIEVSPGGPLTSQLPLLSDRQAPSDQHQNEPQKLHRQQRKRQVPRWKDAVAGACAGAFSKTAMAPVERIKLLLQLQGSAPRPARLSAAPSASAAQKGGAALPPPTAWSVASTIYQREGLFAFWRGNMPNVLRTAGQSALNFALMDYYKRLALSISLQHADSSSQMTTAPAKIGSNSNSNGASTNRRLWISFVSGGLAGGTATTILYPIEFLRTRLAMDQGQTSRQYSGMRDVVTQIWAKDGVRGLYQGYGIALCGGVLHRFLYLGGYDAIKSVWDQQSSTPMTWGERFLIAQFISVTAGTFCYPIDSVRRRLMMQAGRSVQERQYQGSLHCIRTVLATEGARGFYLGIGPNLVRSIGGAMLLVGYDGVKSML